MPVHAWSARLIRYLVLVSVCMAWGCESPPASDETAHSLTRRRARDIAAARLAQDPHKPTDRPAGVPSRLIGPTETQPASPDEIESQIFDPADVAASMQAVLEGELKRLESALKRLEKPPEVIEAEKEQKRTEFQQYLKGVIARTEMIRRPDSIRLSLKDAVRRALMHSYAIQAESYNPAIETTRIVEAEAQFDAVFFANFENNKQDRPSSSQLQGTQSEVRTFQAGVRKLLSSGMTVETSYALTRTETNLSFQTLNPSYFNQFIVDFRQPLLRGFGLDFNRAQIELRRLDRAVSIERLRRNIRETIFNVERAYWRLLQARRNISINARLLIYLETLLIIVTQRDYDVKIADIKQIESPLELSRAQFIRLSNDVKIAEDALKRLLNDPQLNQAMDIEIIPTDRPSLEPLMLDQLGEITAGLMYRSELHETKLAIEQAQIGIGVAKNQALPKLDVMLRMIVDGLGANPDRAFKQLSDNDFTEYVVSLQFEWPIGNRGPEAALLRARQEQAKAIAIHRDQIEGVITQVNQAIRELQTNYDQIGPTLRSAQASQEQLWTTIARRERFDPPYLLVELTALQNLAAARQQLIEVLANYNIALVNLERQKGTLLKYNNIVIRGTDEESYLEPYRPIGP